MDKRHNTFLHLSTSGYTYFSNTLYIIFTYNSILFYLITNKYIFVKIIFKYFITIFFIKSISPGVVETEIFEGCFPSKEIKDMFLANNPCLQPEDISQAVLYALGTPEHVQVCTKNLVKPN